MSATTHPDPPAGAPALVPLEANPQLMTALLHRLGVSRALQMHDVLSVRDAELLAWIPRPALALLLVFPVSAAYESHRLAEDSLAPDYRGAGDDQPVVWWRQTMRNACGLMGLLHAASNGPARAFIEPASTLDRLLRDSIPLEPDARAALLEATPALAAAHAEAAAAGDTPAPDARDDVDLHYVCFVRGADDGLWELDGRRKGPLRRGDLDPDDDVLSPKALTMGVHRFLEREGADLRFSAVALAGALD